MANGDPDISLLSRLLRSRLAAGLNPLSGRQQAHAASDVSGVTDRSSAVIGSLLKDAREAYAAIQAPKPADAPPAATVNAGTIQSAAAVHAQMNDPQADPGDLSAYVLETLNAMDWDDWVSARCDFPQSGPFVASGTSAALDALATIMDSIFDDACNDGDDLTVSIYTAAEAGSARISVTGPFALSLETLGLIKKHRCILESAGGALYTVRNLGTSGFEALIPAR